QPQPLRSRAAVAAHGVRRDLAHPGRGGDVDGATAFDAQIAAARVELEPDALAGRRFRFDHERHGRVGTGIAGRAELEDRGALGRGRGPAGEQPVEQGRSLQHGTRPPLIAVHQQRHVAAREEQHAVRRAERDVARPVPALESDALELAQQTQHLLVRGLPRCALEQRDGEQRVPRFARVLPERERGRRHAGRPQRLDAVRDAAGQRRAGELEAPDEHALARRACAAPLVERAALAQLLEPPPARHGASPPSSAQRSTTLPNTSPSSSSRCASCTSSAGSTRSSTGRTRRCSSNGSAWCANARAAWIFSSSGRARSVVPSMRRRFVITTRRSSSAREPATVPTNARRPRLASARRLPARYAPPTRSSTASTPTPPVNASAASAKSSRVVSTPRSRPSDVAFSSFHAERDVPTTRAPAAFASWSAAVPTPLPTACTSTASPNPSPRRVNSA